MWMSDSAYFPALHLASDAQGVSDRAIHKYKKLHIHALAPFALLVMTSDDPQFVLVNDNKVILTKSDGDASQLPDPEEREVESKIVNYLAEADDETVHSWLMKIGSYLVYMGDWHKPSESKSLLVIISAS